MKRPTPEQLTIAIEWLRCNEGEGVERVACEAVANWLAHEETERTIRSAAREVGVTTAVFRRRLAERMKAQK